MFITSLTSFRSRTQPRCRVGRWAERNHSRKESREHYLGATRDFQAVTHDCCPRRVPGQTSCRPEPGGLCTVYDSWLHNLKQPKASQVISVNRLCWVLSRFPGWSLGCQDSPPPPSFLCLISDPQGVSRGSKKANSTLFPSWGSYSSLIFVLLLLLYSSLKCWGSLREGVAFVPKLDVNCMGLGFFSRPKSTPHKCTPWARTRVRSLSIYPLPGPTAAFRY